MLKVITTVGTSIFSNYDRVKKDIDWDYLNKPFKEKDEKKSLSEKKKDNDLSNLATMEE